MRWNGMSKPAFAPRNPKPKLKFRRARLSASMDARTTPSATTASRKIHWPILARRVGRTITWTSSPGQRVLQPSVLVELVPPARQSKRFGTKVGVVVLAVVADRLDDL